MLRNLIEVGVTHMSNGTAGAPIIEVRSAWITMVLGNCWADVLGLALIGQEGSVARAREVYLKAVSDEARQANTEGRDRRPVVELFGEMFGVSNLYLLQTLVETHERGFEVSSIVNGLYAGIFPPETL